MGQKERKHVATCFGCSQENPVGLRVNFELKNDSCFGEFISNRYHMGPPDSVHGGIIMSLIDEAISTLGRGLLTYDVRTIKNEITFRNAAKIGERIYIEASLKEEKSRIIVAMARVSSNNKVVAEGISTLLKIKGRCGKSAILSQNRERRSGYGMERCAWTRRHY